MLFFVERANKGLRANKLVETNKGYQKNFFWGGGSFVN